MLPPNPAESARPAHTRRSLSPSGSRDKRFDIALDVVDVERRPRCPGHVEPPHQRLCAVVTGANANPLTIENCREVVRMHIAEREAQYAAPLARGRSIDVQTLDRRETLLRLRHQRSLVREHAIHANAVEILDRG